MLTYIFIVPSAVDMLNIAQSVDVYTCTSIQVEIEWDEIQFDVVCIINSLLLHDPLNLVLHEFESIDNNYCVFFSPPVT